jgi:PAS domain S-box-containing protein
MIAVVIEERRRAEESARDSQRLLAMTINTARVGVWGADLESGKQWADDLMIGLFGLLPSQVSRQSVWLERIHPEDRARVASDYANAQRPDAPRDERGDTPIPENEFRVLHPDDSLRWVLTRGAVWRRGDGQPYRATGIGIDITERRRSAEATRESDERMALAAAAANIGFWSLEIATREIWLSKHCYTLLGLSSHADDTQAVFESVIQSTGLAGDDDGNEDAREGRTSSAHEFRVVWPTGEAHWIVSTARRVGSSSDGSLRVIGMLRDITEQRLAALEARERHQDLAHLARIATIGELSATIVHEIGQPIGAVMFNAQAASGMLERGDPDVEQLRDIVRDILRDNQRAGDVISQLRKLLRRDELKREKLDLRQVVREALDLVHVELAKQGIELKLNVAGDMPYVLGNRSQLQQVLLNVILNARDAMTEVAVDRRQLEVRVERLADSSAIVSIADSGSGMTVERLGHLFEPFVTSKTHGLGLGLAISRSIMLEHGGDLRAERIPDGAVLHLILPAFEAAQVADAKPKTDYELRTVSLPSPSDYSSPAQAPPS